MPSRIGNYTLTRTLGEGATAKVKLGEAPNGQKVAIKLFNADMKQATKQALQAELETMQKLNHRNIVNSIEYCHQVDWIHSNGSKEKRDFLALEIADGGEIFDFIATGGGFKEPICRYFFKQMLAAIHYMHSNGVSHRDLKPENILLDEMYNVKVADFGFAAPIEGRTGEGKLKTYLGTESYMAPELHNRLEYVGPQVDIFALGLILFILHTGHPPFAKAKQNDPHYKWFYTNRADKFWAMHQKFQAAELGPISPEFMDMITQMYQFNTSQRLEMADILGHPWFTAGPTASNAEVQLEFRRRHEKILEQRMQEQAQKEMLKQQRRAMGGGVARALNPEEEHKKMGTWDAKYHKSTEFFTTYEAHEVFEELDKQLSSLEGFDKDSVRKDPKKWRVTFNVARAFTGQQEQQQEQEDEDEEESKIEVEDETLEATMIVKVLAVDENKRSVEFSKVEGSSAVLFYETYMNLQGLMGDFADAV